MSESNVDPTFYRTAADAAAAPPEKLAYVVAFDRQPRRAMRSQSSTWILRRGATGESLGGPMSRRSETSCIISGGTRAAVRSSTKATTWTGWHIVTC
jgi:hypothetical protein